MILIDCEQSACCQKKSSRGLAYFGYDRIGYRRGEGTRRSGMVHSCAEWRRPYGILLDSGVHLFSFNPSERPFGPNSSGKARFQMTRKDQTAGPSAVLMVGSRRQRHRREMRSSGEEAAEAVSIARGGRLRARAVLRRSVGRCGALASGRSWCRLGHLGGSCLGLGLGVGLHLAGLVAALGLAFAADVSGAGHVRC